MKNLLLLSLFLLVAAGCNEQVSQPGTIDPHAQWLSRNIHEYSIEQINICYCVKGGTKILLFVRADTIYRALQLPDSTALPNEEIKYYHSVKDLFSVILNPGKDSLVIQYNAEFGYPEKLDINPQQHPVDGGVLIESSNIRVN